MAESKGVYVYVSYPRTSDIKFDTDYYFKTHMSIVEKHWKPFGMKSWTVVQFPEGDPSGQHTQAIMLWESTEDFQKAIDANIPEVMQDITNYSNVMPVRYFGEVLAQG